MQDYTTSNNPKFLFFAELNHPFPDWVAASPIPKAADFEKMASAAFADTSRRLLPINTKEAAFHSALDYMAHIDQYAESVGERIKEACEFFGIIDDVTPYAEVFATKLEKEAAAEASAPGEFAISDVIGGVQYQLLPLNDRTDVESSAMELAKMASEDRIHFLHLRPAAQAVVRAAEQHGVSVPLIVARVGAERTANLSKAASLISNRASFTGLSGDEAAQLQAQYDAVVKSAAEGAIDAEECVRQIAAIDHIARLDYSFRKQSNVLLPSEIVFCGPLVAEVEKAARAHVSVGDVLIPLSEFKKIDLTEADFKLSKTAAEELRAVADTDDAIDISLAVMGWEPTDQRTLLRLAAAV